MSGVFIITRALCYNQASGSINVTGAGGSSPYSYAINTGVFSATHLFGGLLAGSDSIHLKDANGCKFDTSVTVTQPALIVPGIAITPPLCNGAIDGSVNVSATGGTPAFTYSYDGETYTATSTFTGLAAGTDSVKVKDANGCIHDTTFIITQPGRIRFTAVIPTNISCFDGADGTVTITGSGATPPYMYGLNTIPWQTGDEFTGVAAGLQLVKIKDANGCEIDTNVTLTQPTKLLFSSLDSLNPTCPGYKDGQVAIAATGGTIAYAYSDDGATFGATGAFAALAAGVFTFTVKDADGCTIDTTITLTGLPQIVVDNIQVNPASCFRAKDGSVSVTASGGAQPLQYQFNGDNQKTSNTLYTKLNSGDYPIVITDSRNCSLQTDALVPQPDSMVIVDSVTPNECYGLGKNGTVAANVTGGTQPYTYLWSGDSAQATNAEITGLANGKYTVWVKDANNCTDSSTADVQYNDCCTPAIPNAFTPNDDGKDDIFRLLFFGDMYIVRFSVYNRFGQEVYNLTNTSDQTKGWDGKFLGVNAEMGTYYYYAKIICGNKGDHIKELKGDLTLIR